MASLEQYIVDMEAMPDETITGDGLIVLPMTASTTGTCGVTTPEAGLPLPPPNLVATGSWPPCGRLDLPALTATGALDAWHPAWGGAPLPRPEVTAQGSLALLVDLALTPLFADIRAGGLGQAALPAWSIAAGTGAAADLELPLPSPYGLSGLDRAARLGVTLPRTTATAWACGLDDPVTNATSSDAVVALLCQGNGELVLAATSLVGEANLASLGADDLAGALLSAVADNLTYAADDGEIWTCAMGTYTRGTGDCEDGAILLHALLLAAGIPADRLVTVFGRVGVTRLGHAWVSYRRVSDGNWVVLDWTAGTTSTPVTDLPPIERAPAYALVDYALTARAFFAVHQQATTFFPASCAVHLSLPGLSVTGEAALGATMVCALESDWLRTSAQAAAMASARLPQPKIAGTAGGNHASAFLPDPVLAGRSAPVARADLPASAMTATALGTWARGGLALRPGLDAQAVTAHLVRGQFALSRARLAATGLCGSRAMGNAPCRSPHLLARAWPGGLARCDETLPPFDVSGLALATDPGSGNVSLATLVSRARAASAAETSSPWQTALPEEWV